MFLAVDVGNTQTTLGLFDEKGCVARQWRMATDATDTSDELHERLYGYFQMLGLALDSVTDVAVASVVPVLSREWQQMTRAILGTDPMMVSATRDCGIRADLPNPNEVGADRIANALAARETYGSPVIVVDFGTATNIDVVDAHGNFRGGAIMPGLMLSANSLFSRAAKLASVPLVVPPHTLGDTTERAVQSGIVVGAAAQAEGLVARIQRELARETAAEKGLEAEDVAPATVVGTGGLAGTIAEATDLFDAIDSDLTIRGIHQIWLHRTLGRGQRDGA